MYTLSALSSRTLFVHIYANLLHSYLQYASHTVHIHFAHLRLYIYQHQHYSARSHIQRHITTCSVYTLQYLLQHLRKQTIHCCTHTHTLTGVRINPPPDLTLTFERKVTHNSEHITHNTNACNTVPTYKFQRRSVLSIHCTHTSLCIT